MFNAGRSMLLFFFFLPIVTSSAAEKPPNIVIILADDLGWADVSYHGGYVRTPNIDKLTTEGVELDRFYVSPMCSPTRRPVFYGPKASTWCTPTSTHHSSTQS